MKKLILMSAVAACLSVPAMACATDYRVGTAFDSKAINGMSLPAGKIAGMQLYSEGYATGEAFTYGSGNHMNYLQASMLAGKFMRFDGGHLFAGVTGGYERLGYDLGHVSAAYAGARVGYSYQIGRDLSVAVDGAFGRDFATSATVDPNTTGGLFYQAGAAVNFAHVGPGVLGVRFQYRHLPISESSGLHLNTRTYGVGYHVTF